MRRAILASVILKEVLGSDITGSFHSCKAKAHAANDTVTANARNFCENNLLK